MKRSVRIGAWLLVMLMTMCLFAGCQKETVQGAKTITVTITYADKTVDEETIHTDAEYLASALAEAELIEYDESGYYTTVNGVTADYDKDQSWWCLTKEGVMTTEGLNTQPIADGESYEITYTIG